jgi:P4 family phage/plasmid primase-like protien
MYFDRKNISGMSAIPTAKMAMAMNEAPRIRDKSEGVWRRMLLVPFSCIVPEAERIRGMDTVEFWRLSGELPGMAAWALIGLVRLLAFGKFTEPKISEAQIEEYRQDMDPLRTYASANLKEKEGVILPRPVMYDHYKEWCEESNHKPVSMRKFTQGLKRFFPEVDFDQQRRMDVPEYSPTGTQVSPSGKRYDIVHKLVRVCVGLVVC